MKQFMLFLFAILLFNSCGGTEIEEKTNPYKGVKTIKKSEHSYIKEAFGESVYKKKPSEVRIERLNKDGQNIEKFVYTSSGKVKEAVFLGYGTDLSRGGGLGGKIIRKYDEEGRLHTKHRNYVNGKEYGRWEYEYTEFDSIKSVTLFDSIDSIKYKWEHLFDERKRKIETNYYDSNDSLKKKIKVHYSRQPDEIIEYNSNGEATEKTETWYNRDSLKMQTKTTLLDRGITLQEKFYTYDTLGNVTEVKSTFLNRECIATINYDSTGKRINEFLKCRILPNEIEYKPISKTVYEYEYYDNEG